MHKRKFHKRNSSLSQNLKTKHTNSLQTLQFEAIEKKNILRQLRNKASNLKKKTYLFKDLVIDESRCLYSRCINLKEI